MKKKHKKLAVFFTASFLALFAVVLTLLLKESEPTSSWRIPAVTVATIPSARQSDSLEVDKTPSFPVHRNVFRPSDDDSIPVKEHIVAIDPDPPSKDTMGESTDRRAMQREHVGRSSDAVSRVRRLPPSPVDSAELRSAEGDTIRTERMERHPEVAVLTLDDGARYALPSEIVRRLLNAPELTDEQRMFALLSYPKLVEATTDDATAEHVARAAAETVGERPPAPVAMEIMEDPDLRAAAFRVPEPIQDYLDSLPTPADGVINEE